VRGFAAFVGTSLALMGAPSAHAEAGECFDLKIRAKPVAEIPTEIVHEPDYIVMSWPWFVDLEVKRVLEGDFKEKQLTALAVLHSGYARKTRVFLLRRNTLGGFNIFRHEQPETLQKCDASITPMRPYLRPADGKSLEDYRRAGEQWLERFLADEKE
jgi:hypothetical protein